MFIYKAGWPPKELVLLAKQVDVKMHWCPLRLSCSTDAQSLPPLLLQAPSLCHGHATSHFALLSCARLRRGRGHGPGTRNTARGAPPDLLGQLRLLQVRPLLCREGWFYRQGLWLPDVCGEQRYIPAWQPRLICHSRGEGHG